MKTVKYLIVNNTATSYSYRDLYRLVEFRCGNRGSILVWKAISWKEDCKWGEVQHA